MIKTKLFLFSLLALLMACKQSNEVKLTEELALNEDTITEEHEVLESLEEKSPKVFEPVVASWVGSFVAEEYDESTDYTYSNLINISIDEIAGDQVKGHSVVAGNFRPFEGTVTKDGESYHFNLEEPGDDVYDGVFTFTVSKDSILKGLWSSYDKSLKVTKRRYELRPRIFTYNPENSISGMYEFIDLGKYKKVVEYYDGEEYYDEQIATVTNKAFEWNASTQLIPEEEIANMKKGDLQIIRNTIYARHGYSFKNKIYRTIFDHGGIDWYMPVSVNVEDYLTEIEKQNIAMIKRYEDYAEDYYDSFGR